MKIVSGHDCSGGNGNFKGQVLVQSDKYDILPPEVKNKISSMASKAVMNVKYMIEIEWAKIHLKDKRKENTDVLLKYAYLIFFHAVKNLLEVRVAGQHVFEGLFWFYVCSSCIQKKHPVPNSGIFMHCIIQE